MWSKHLPFTIRPMPCVNSSGVKVRTVNCFVLTGNLIGTRPLYCRLRRHKLTYDSKLGNMETAILLMVLAGYWHMPSFLNLVVTCTLMKVNGGQIRLMVTLREQVHLAHVQLGLFTFRNKSVCSIAARNWSRSRVGTQFRARVYHGTNLQVPTAHAAVQG